jgi:hypothetical protein
MTFISHAVLPISLKIGFVVLIIGLERLLGWERLPLFGRYEDVEMINCFVLKFLLLCRSSTDVRIHSIMVVFLADGTPLPVNGGLCTAEDYDERYFFPA